MVRLICRLGLATMVISFITTAFDFVIAGVSMSGVALLLSLMAMGTFGLVTVLVCKFKGRLHQWWTSVAVGNTVALVLFLFSTAADFVAEDGHEVMELVGGVINLLIIAYLAWRRSCICSHFPVV